jgi:hypothetical protein
MPGSELGLQIELKIGGRNDEVTANMTVTSKRKAQSLLLAAVLVSMCFTRIVAALRSLSVMTTRCLRMVRCFLVTACIVMFCCFFRMFGSLLVMFRCFFMMLCCFLAHDHSIVRAAG